MTDNIQDYANKKAFKLDLKAFLLLMFIFTIGFIMRFAYMDQPLFYDEAFSYYHYADRSWPVVLAKYDYPNNHILHTAAMKISVSLFGPSAFNIRLPAFVGGCLLILLVFMLTYRLEGIVTASIAATLTACSTQMILYSTNGRGYSLMACALVVTWYAFQKLLQAHSRKHQILSITSQSIGLAISPVMSIPLVFLHIHTFLHNRFHRESNLKPNIQLRTSAIAVSIAVLFYLPAMLFTTNLHSEHILQSNMFPDFDKSMDMLRLMYDFIVNAATGFPWPIQIGLAVMAVVAMVKNNKWSIITVAFSLLMICCWLLPIQSPPLRTLSPIIPLLFIMISSGAATAMNSLTLPKQWIVVILLCMTLSLSSVMTQRDFSPYEFTAIKNHKELFAILNSEIKSSDAILTQFPMEASVRAYADIYGLPDDVLNANQAYAGKTAIILSTQHGQIDSLALAKNEINQEAFFSNHQLDTAITIDENTVLHIYDLKK
ncbi:MAG: glycosyltransferase family 39 protein [Bacteroidia bacterium]